MALNEAIPFGAQGYGEEIAQMSPEAPPPINLS